MLISLSGKLGVGKDAVAAMIIKHSPTFKAKAFAYKLKEIVVLLTSCTIEDTMTQKGKNKFIPEFDMTIGQMLQKIGTDVMREGFHKNVWINALMMEIDKAPGDYVITDCRFMNEAMAIKDAGGYIWRIERPINPIRNNSTRDMTHPSECEMDDYDGFDMVINNDTDLVKLESKVIYALNDVLRAEIIA